jgi:putative endopeptidase
MRLSWTKAFLFGLFLVGVGLLLVHPGSAQPASNIAEPDHFDLNSVDTTLDPCNDFYEYACHKWMAANPIPADQAGWSHGAKLNLWNQQVLRSVLEKAASGGAERSAVEQKIGDYYGSCVDESAINSKGVTALKAELDRMAAMASKKALAGEVAHLHQITFALAPPSDSGSSTTVFGFGAQQDFDDASKVVAAADQGGLGLPDRDYYFKDDAKSVETRNQYLSHVQKVFELLGEPSAKAATDAKVVMAMETSLA